MSIMVWKHTFWANNSMAELTEVLNLLVLMFEAINLSSSRLCHWLLWGRLLTSSKAWCTRWSVIKTIIIMHHIALVLSIYLIILGILWLNSSKLCSYLFICGLHFILLLWNFLSLPTTGAETELTTTCFFLCNYTFVANILSVFIHSKINFTNLYYVIFNFKIY